MELGEKIKQLREKQGLTLEELGNRVGVGKSTVRKWENGMIANMRRDKIGKVAKALNVSPAYLMGWPEESPKVPDVVTTQLTPDESSLVDDYRSLNDTGKQKAREQISDLKEIPRYTSGVRFMGQLTPYNENVSPDLLPNAAHERTDIAVDPADREADEELLARIEKEGK